MADQENLGAARVTSLEVVKPTQEQRKRWQSLCDDTRDMTNFIWQQWLCYHVENGTRDKIIDFLRDLDAWKADKKGDKPKVKLQAVPKDLASRIYHGMMKTFPQVHSRSQGLLQQRTVSLIGSRKAAKGNLSGWWAILLYHESVPSSTRGVPVLFDVRNAKILPPESKDGHHRIELRIERKGKSSVYDVVDLWSKGRKAAGAVAILKKLLSGEAKFCGSNLVQRQNGKWFVNICWRAERQATKTLDHTQTAILRPCANVPWKLKTPGRNRRPGGMGYVVQHVRSQLLTSRWSRAEAYRNASSSRKGQGRERAIVATTKLSMRWRDFVKTFNHQVTSDVVQTCVIRGIGKLVYCQPVGNADSRFLAKAGKVPDRHDATGWDWFQVGALLAYKCEREGIELEIRKSCDVLRRRESCEELPKGKERKVKSQKAMC